MSGPSWPRLAAFTARAQWPSARGRWLAVDERGRRTGSFVVGGPDAWVLQADDGRAVEAWTLRDLRRREFDRPDYTTAAAPPVAVEHAGRPCWQVDLLPPPHKSGLLRTVVDAETGLLLSERNLAVEHETTITELELGPVSDAELAEHTARRAREQAERRLQELVRAHPVPTPRFLPGRRTFGESASTLGIHTDRGDGYLRLVDGAPPDEDLWWQDGRDVVTARDEQGRTWQLCAAGPLTEADVELVLRSVVSRPAQPGGR